MKTLEELEVMDDIEREKIRTELKELDIKSNPFEIMFQRCADLTRQMLFVARRYNHPDKLIRKQCISDINDLRKYMDKIITEYEKISSMSNDLLAVCEHTAFNRGQQHDVLNNVLMMLSEIPATVLSRDVPVQDTLLDELLLDEDELKRRKELSSIIETYRIPKSFIRKVEDAVLGGEEVSDNGVIKFIEGYSIRENDAHILSCLVKNRDMNDTMLAYK